MSIEGVRFCDVCGGAIGVDDIAPVRVNEDGHLVQLHLHNRRRDDCLAQKLSQWAEQYARDGAAAVSDAQEPAQQEV